jgi:hypothetical protein
MHRMNATPEDNHDKVKADAMKGDYNDAIKRNTDEMMHQATVAKRRLQDKLAAKAAAKAAAASNAALPVGHGLRWGTPIHAQFHRRKAKKLKEEMEGYEEGTKEHHRAKRRYEKRQAIADAAWHTATNPETQYKFKEYEPVFGTNKLFYHKDDYPHRQQSKWISHVKAFSKNRGISYKEAMSHPEAKEAYRNGDYSNYDEAPPAAPQRKKRKARAAPEPFQMSLRPRKGRGLAAHIASLPFV